jgi:hypothetical protein
MLLLAHVSSASAVTTFNFTVTRACHTSAGVYNSSGILVRTLWRDASANGAGTYTATWDDRTDSGLPARPGTYTIKVLAHNVNYVWEGVVGNTSDDTSGPAVHHNIHFATALCFTGSRQSDARGFYACGYTENSPPFFSFAATAPQKVLSIINGCTSGGNNYSWRLADSDGAGVAYFACPATLDPANNKMTKPGAVCAFNSDGSVMPFSSGGRLYDQYHPFVNGIHVGRRPNITGLAVEKGSDDRLMAVSVAVDDKVYLLDKTSGSVVASFRVRAPGAMAFDADDNLWVVSGKSVQQYTHVNASPDSPGLGVTIRGFAAPLALAASPRTASQPNLLLVADGGASQQIKAYDRSGRAQWTYGRPGGYATDPAVTNDKFWFYEGQETVELTSIAFQPDGSFWVIDPMNNRILHLDLSPAPGRAPTYRNQIAFMEWIYCISVDVNNPTRVFACADGKWLEFKVNYGVPLGGTNGSWTLVKNWGYGLPAKFYAPFISGLGSVATLSNGRTYALLRDDSTNKCAVYELPARGPLRPTGVRETNSSFLYADGSLRTQTCENEVNTFAWQSLTGFDHSGNPRWGRSVTLAKTPGVTNRDPAFEGYSGGPKVVITPSHTLVFFDDSSNLGMHLGGIDLDGDRRSWAWEASPAIQDAASPSTDLESILWGDGSYDDANGINYEGGLHDGIGRDIVYLYKGENWQGGEANQLMHFYDDGLFVGQFGTAGNNGLVCPQGCGGNYQMDAMTTVGSSTYLYANDESQHGGIHRWRLDGLNTEAELTGRGRLDSTISLSGIAPAQSPPPLGDVPATVTRLTAAAGKGNIFLEWTPAATGLPATYFQIRRSESAHGLFQIIATSVFENDFTDTDVANGKTYYYEIVPIDQYGAGPASMTPPATPGPKTHVYEAESGVIAGTQVQFNRFASGNYEVLNADRTSVTINNVDGGSGGAFVLDIRYSWPYSAWTQARLKVNGESVSLPAFPKTPEDPPVFGDVTVNIELHPGTGNSIVMTNFPALDKFTITAPHG